MFAAVTASCCLVVGRAGTVLVRGQRAQAAADSVALAWVMSGGKTAERVARELEARIVSATDDGTIAEVVIDADGTRRSAIAMRAPATGPSRAATDESG